MPELAAATAGEPWWKTAVIYEVYPRSFADGNGDGVGDLPGLLARLPYLASLGVDGFWLTPFQTSPQVDQGYDVSDYRGVDPLFGTPADFDAVLDRAHGLGLRVLVDVVPNHCSVEHPLFRQALAAGPGSNERELFHFAEGHTDGSPPNNWQSVFGGPAWTRADPESTTDTQWYLHLFSPAQPDWNWRNPAVGDYFFEVLRFWLDKGVDGLRIDVAHALFKAEGLPDSSTGTPVVDGLRSNRQVSDQEEVHAVYRRWRTLADSYSPPRVLVGEVNLDPHRAARYTRPDELHQAFAFAFVRLGWDPVAWAVVGAELEAARKAHGAAPTWALENHDVVRTATRFGGGGRGAARARAALLIVLGLPGGAYIYQGQELGLPEAEVPPAARRDPMVARGGISRDGARVPLPWTVDAASAHGFSMTDPAAEPWLPQPPGWGQGAIEAQRNDPASPQQLVVRALELRRRLLAEGVLDAGDGASWHVDDGGLLLCERGHGFLLAVAMGEGPVRLPAGTVLITAVPQAAEGWLEPDNAAWLLRARS
ncbi:alpha-amylase family glycosyl hydrolase [Arthrobacter crusticola]|uniref:alpha-amylase family glycosyl hydrolase n=1 Tax=Arthrobacter crusticola TaxID=2547960 RepID=UPI001FE8FADF|nr:alpha-amylase family glycosyl hydrolase [Arthrobacter crusticola]